MHLIKSGEAPGGIGETGVTTAPPAIRNAIYAATGIALAAAADRRRRVGGKKEGLSFASRTISGGWSCFRRRVRIAISVRDSSGI